jgi:hypothetical protein
MSSPLIGGSGRRLTAGPGHARTGIQIARFGTTPGGYLGDQVADHNGIGSRTLELVTTVTLR